MKGTDFVFLAIGIAALVGLYYFFFMREGSGSKRLDKAKDLSDAAAKPLAAAKRFAALQQYEVIAPAALAKNGRFADLDFIIVGCFGLLCVKCIGRGGEIYGSEGDAKWLQVRGETRTSFENPILQAAADTRLVRDTLFTANLKNIPVETVCVFTNKNASLALPRSTGHLTVKEFRALLDKEKYRTDKHVDIAKASAAVRAYLAPANGVKAV